MKKKWRYKPMATPVPAKHKKRKPMATPVSAKPNKRKPMATKVSTASIIILGLASAL